MTYGGRPRTGGGPLAEPDILPASEVKKLDNFHLFWSDLLVSNGQLNFD